MDKGKKKKPKLRPSVVLQEIVLAAVTLITMIPVYYFAIGAFKDRKQIIKHPMTINAKNFTLDNFPTVIKKLDYFESLRNTATITVCALLLLIICSSLAGYVIARLSGKVYKVYYSILVALMVVPFIGCIIPLTVMSVKLKLYNSLLGCILIQAAWNTPFGVFLYTGFMKGIPKEVEESAYMDGCNMFGVYLRIFLPLLKPVTATCCIRQGVGIWNDFLVSNSLLSYGKTPTLMVGVNEFFGSRATEFGYAFAAIILASIPMIVLFLFLQKYFIKGIVAGAVKA